MTVQMPNIQRALKTLGLSMRGQAGIGLDVGHATITIAEISNGTEKKMLRNVVVRPYTARDNVSHILRSLFQEYSFTGKQVNVSLRGDDTVIRIIDFPYVSKKDLQSALQFEAEKYLPFNLDEAVIDFHVLGEQKREGEQKSIRMILVAARKHAVTQLTSLIKQAELEVHCIDLDPLACVNAFQWSHESPQEAVVGLLDIGQETSTLIVLRGGALVFVRDITFGGEDLTQALVKRCQLEYRDAEALKRTPTAFTPAHRAAVEESLEYLVTEIGLSLSYCENQVLHKDSVKPTLHQGVVETLHCSGGTAGLALMREYLEHRLQIPCHAWNPLERFTASEAVKQQCAVEQLVHLPVSIGLALRSAG